ncbi:MAG: hypothetical protein PHN69_02560 [Candidatus Pacebacteria bacterium]|nr:hypothetical protein [Candidatus Paceibacterota bacterium]
MKYIKDVRIKLCEVIGLDYYDISFYDGSVYDKHTWNFLQQNVFKEWFCNYLLTNPEACRFFIGGRTRSKKLINDFIDEYIKTQCWRNI